MMRYSSVNAVEGNSRRSSHRDGRVVGHTGPQLGRRRRRGPRKNIGNEIKAPNEIVNINSVKDKFYSNVDFAPHKVHGPGPPLINLSMHLDFSTPDLLPQNDDVDTCSREIPPEDENLNACLSEIYARNETELRNHAVYTRDINTRNAERATEKWLEQKSTSERQAYLATRTALSS